MSACANETSCPTGAEGCACTGGGACDPGLECRALLCVAATDGGVDAGETDAGGSFLAYRYVMILDRLTSAEGATGAECGSDIDAVELVHAGASAYAAQFHEAMTGPCDVVATAGNFNFALGAPQGDCSAGSFVSLGTDTGYLIVSFDGLAEIVEGDSIVVHGCSVGEGSDRYDVLVGTGTTLTDPNWIQVATDASGVTSATVPTLPAIPAP